MGLLHYIEILLHYIEIENFKTFEKKIRVDLTHPAVLIGPNNTGKTSVIQAVALWSRGVRAWYYRRGKFLASAPKSLSAGINRKDILEIQTPESRFLWSNTQIRHGYTPIQIGITIGIEVEGRIVDCGVTFTQRDNEVIYCRPSQQTLADERIIAKAAEFRVGLLYPMSGMATEEPLFQEGRINFLMGQGQTAQVLRNICYSVWESNEIDWNEIVSWMKRMFSVDMGKPLFDPATGALELRYHQKNSDRQLDITAAGRGMQQVLLILSFLFRHKNSVLLIDEPDAHLEILRQKQVFEIIKHLTAQQGSQTIMVTHAEVIIDNAIESNLTLILNGEARNLAFRQDIKKSIKEISAETYYKAQILPRILYLEGSTDLEMLRVLAERLNHPAKNLLNDRLNYYYSRNIHSEDTLENRLDRIGGAFREVEAHFHSLKHIVPEIRAVGIFDGDLRNRQDDIKPDLALLYWQYYELENYFIIPEVLFRYVEAQLLTAPPHYSADIMEKVRSVLEVLLTKLVFKGEKSQLTEFARLSTNLQRQMLQNVKMSDFTEQVFEQLSVATGQPVLLRKGQFYQLIEYLPIDQIPSEVTEKLDRLVEYLGTKHN